MFVKITNPRENALLTGYLSRFGRFCKVWNKELSTMLGSTPNRIASADIKIRGPSMYQDGSRTFESSSGSLPKKTLFMVHIE